MTSSSTSFQKSFRAAILGATSLGLASIVAAPALMSNTTAAYAEPVRVEGQQVVGFADVVEKVAPAVVSVRVKSDVKTRNFAQRGGNPLDIIPGFRDLPKDHPFNRFFREFGENNERGQRSERQEEPKKDDNQPPRRQFSGQGSGFFISEDGLVVTNNHVIDGGAEFFIVTNDGTELEAELIGKDARTDLALLQVKEKKKFTYVKFADKDSRVGEWVVAVGNPFGLGGTVTAGIISARGRDIGASRYNDFIQIDAAVNKGNSGGPAFNLNGEVIGINTAIFSRSGGNVGIAFAIPAETAKSVITDLKSDGKVVRGYLGVQIQDITRDLADGIGLADTAGALVASTTPETPAGKAGIKSGDAIIAVNGETVEDTKDLSRRIAGFRPDTKVALTVFRNGDAKEIDVTLGTLPERIKRASLQSEPAKPAEPEAMEEFGLELKSAEGGEGLEVTQISPTSVLAGKALRVGDTISQIDSQSVDTPKAAKEVIAAAREKGKKAVLLRVESANGIRFVALPLKKKG